MSNRQIIVKQIRSGTGHTKREKATLSALGLGRIGKTKEHKESPALNGMIARVSHLVEVRLK